MHRFGDPSATMRRDTAGIKHLVLALKEGFLQG